MVVMILVLILGVGLGTSSMAQEIKTNSEGEAILSMPDGSWRYLEMGDTIYAEKDPEWGIEEYRHYLSAAKKFEEEIREVVDKSQEKMYTLDNKHKAAKEANDVYAEQEVALERDAHEEKLEKQESQLKYVRSLIKDIEKIGLRKKYEKLSKISIPLRYLNLTKDNYLDHQEQVVPMVQADDKKSEKTLKSPSSKKKVKHLARTSKDRTKSKGDKKARVESNKSIDVVRSSWEYQLPRVTATESVIDECAFAFDGVDDFSGNSRRDLHSEIFFTHTDARLRPYLRGRDYIVAEGYLSSVSGGYRYLTLTVRIASKNAKREYGAVKPSSLLRLSLLDNSTVSLFSQNGNSGRLDPVTGDVIYKITYGIDYQKAKLLSRSEVDQVRMVWSSGYEDYVVFNVDFFMRQLECLESKVN